MTTQVPEGTSDDAVQEIRSREAARSGRLAAQGHLLRLWRPPRQPGEWRTLGLFAADDDAGLEGVLGSMPLRVWRTDQVTPLAPHPNDPGPPSGSLAGSGGTEFLTVFTVTGPDPVAAEVADRSEADRARELVDRGSLERLWRLPGEGRALGLWRAPDPAGMDATLGSLPLAPWMQVETTPLSPHPSDPRLPRAEDGGGHE